MNKLKFNDGGQPVYLDDLNVLQELPAEYASAILGGLLTSPVIEGEINTLKATVPLGTDENHIVGYFLHFYPLRIGDSNRWRFDPGAIYIGGEILDFDMAVVELTSNNPFYVIVHEDEQDIRTLDNGSQGGCKVSRYAELSATPSETLPSYPSSMLGDLMDAITLKVRSKLDVLPDAWVPLDVDFLAGYSGEVQFCETKDSYKLKINITSQSTTEYSRTSSTSALQMMTVFYVNSPSSSIWQRFAGVSGLFYPTSRLNYVGFAPLRLNVTSTHASVTGTPDTDYPWTPQGTPIKMFFEIPK